MVYIYMCVCVVCMCVCVCNCNMISFVKEYLDQWSMQNQKECISNCVLQIGYNFETITWRGS
jgi:hypothetical protein